ncbi:phage antirepressor N-terminal domain-containing protein [Methylobacterium sp. NMS12]
MRPVEGMGLAWTRQHAKLNAGADRYGVRNDIITRDRSGRQQEMACIPLRRYPMWLATINPAKIPSPAAGEQTSRHLRSAMSGLPQI